jgi:hypothetical protein
MTNKNSGVIYIGDRMAERGIFLPDGTFESDKQIRRKAVDSPEMGTEKKFPRDFGYWSDRFIRRQQEYGETSDVETDHVTIRFKKDTIINFIGDTHPGSPYTHYDRLEKEIKAIDETPNSYVVLCGDLVDGFWFNPAQMEQMEQPPEQFAYMQALINHLAQNRKLLIAFGGDHCGWAKKMGLDPYSIMNNMGAYYMQGVGHLTALVDDQEYKITGAHRLPGFSIRDNTWASKRASQEVQGADIYFNAHTHTKGHSEQSVNEFGGSSRKVHHISLGPYKPTDEFARKLGFAQQDANSMYGCAIELKSDSKDVIYYDDILKANK